MLDKLNECLAFLFFVEEFGLKLLFFFCKICVHTLPQ